MQAGDSVQHYSPKTPFPPGMLFGFALGGSVGCRVSGVGCRVSGVGYRSERRRRLREGGGWWGRSGWARPTPNCLRFYLGGAFSA
jgi:hypothetical protein